MIDGQLMGPFAQSEQLRPVGHCSHVVIFVKIYCLHVANNICAATPWSYHLTFFQIKIKPGVDEKLAIISEYN